MLRLEKQSKSVLTSQIARWESRVFNREREEEMNIGRGSIRLMSKIFAECTSLGHSSFLYAAVLAVLALSLALAGCGDISLGQLLESQDPGELGITPQTATISTGASLEINGKGGFTPYNFSATAGSIEEIDAVTYYTAPDSPTEVTITVADTFSNEATATIQIVSSSSLNFPQAMTIEIGENTGFVIATGGTPPYTFDFEGEGTLVPHPVLEDRAKYIAPGFETTVLVWVEDADGTKRTLTVTVVAGSGS
jgi:hypothetical protein